MADSSDLLRTFGWSPERGAQIAALDAFDGAPARVVRVDRGYCQVAAAAGTSTAVIPPKVPWSVAAGDWVAVAGEPLTLTGIAPRRGVLRRRAPSGRREQLLGANIDIVWIVVPLDRQVVPGRLERALVVAYDGEVAPRIVFTKADVATHAGQAAAVLRTVCPWVPQHSVAAPLGQVGDELLSDVDPAHTVALLGESGAGKSTLVNAIVGDEVQITGDVRTSDRKGRHTTTSRELVPVPGGGLLLDTPGIREFGVLDALTGLDAAFPDVARLTGCRFRNCGHTNEAGCAVLAAIDDGALLSERWQRYQVLAEEASATFRTERPMRRGRRW